MTDADGSDDWVWREDAITALLAESGEETSSVSSCKTNQGQFYSQFDQIVLLSAPAEVMLARIAERTDSPYGKGDEERELILHHLAAIEPLLRATATAEIDTSIPLEQVVDHLKAIAVGE